MHYGMRTLCHPGKLGRRGGGGGQRAHPQCKPLTSAKTYVKARCSMNWPVARHGNLSFLKAHNFQEFLGYVI